MRPARVRNSSRGGRRVGGDRDPLHHKGFGGQFNTVSTQSQRFHDIRPNQAGR